MAALSNLARYRDLGLLVLRLLVGISFMAHGFPKFEAGPGMWEQLGSAMGLLGVGFGHVAWGLLAACAEFLGGLLLLIGWQARIAAFFMAFTMFMATLVHYTNGDGFNTYSHSLEMFAVFTGLIFVGPGRYSVDKR